MIVKSIRTFLPSKDFEISKKFYLDLGFEVQWSNDEMILFGCGDVNFFLQKYYNKEWAENLMLQMHVYDLEGLYQVCVSLKEKYEGVLLKPVFETDYGKTFHLIGPSGELWHMTEESGAIVEENKLICEDQ